MGFRARVVAKSLNPVEAWLSATVPDTPTHSGQPCSLKSNERNPGAAKADDAAHHASHRNASQLASSARTMGREISGRVTAIAEEAGVDDRMA